MDLLGLKGVTCTVPGAARPLVEEVSLELRVGDRLALVGPSGAGKSSLLRLVNRLSEPSSGEIRVLGKSLPDWPVRELRRAAALVFQVPALFDGTVRANLLFGPAQAGRALDETRLLELLADVSLAPEFLAREARSLSIGEQQRVALARALALEPRLLLLDEPTSALDPPNARALVQMLVELCTRRSLAAVLVTHQLEHARAFGTRVAFMSGGRIRAVQPVTEFFESPACAEAREFIASGGEESP